MKSRSKTFARKLVALFLAVVMAASCFTGALTAFAKSTDGYYDNDLAANFMTWAETTDNQTAEALLDWADMHLDDLILSLGATGDIMNGDHLNLNLDVAVINIHLEGYLDSIDGVLNLISNARGLVDSYKGLIGGNVGDIDLSAIDQLNAPSQNANVVISKCGKSYRATNDAKDIVLAIAKLLYTNSNDDSGKNVIGAFIKGEFSLGLVNSFVNLYDLLKEPLGLWDNYQNNLVYNIISNLILTKSGWYNDAEIEAYQKDIQANNGNWVLDDQLMDKLSKNLMQEINAEITYAARGASKDGTESSKDRYKEIVAKMNTGMSFEAASEALGFDPNLKYTEDGNVLLFCYGDQKIVIDKNTKLLELGYQVLQLAWKTCLKDTLGTLRVNYSREDNQNYGTNYDNAFYYWMKGNGVWDSSVSWYENYTMANMQAWATAVYKQYDAADAEDFIADVRDNLTLDRTIAADATGSWKDIDSTKLFVKLRYSPIADKCFKMQTGPLNLFMMQTGFANLEAFFANDYKNYKDLASLLNDALLAAAKDLFPESNNIGLTQANGSVLSLTRPTMNKANVTQFTSANTTSNVNSIATTLIDNVVRMFEYAANATDENILNGFYLSHTSAVKTASNSLSEANFEEAMVPFLIACIQNIEATEPIHDEKWDACQDAEGVAFVALEEYLSYVLPEKNYSQLVKLNAQGKYVAGNYDINEDGKYTIFEDAIMPMARDALGYILQSLVPTRTKNGTVWNVYNTNPITDKTTVFDILNSVVCYYASMDSFADGGFNSTSTTGKGVASLLGAMDANGNCLVKSSNTLWQNIDAIANNLLPVLGTLQTGQVADAAKFDSYELLYNKVIKGILDIGPNSGVTNIVKQLLTIVTAAPIRDKGIDELVYDDVLASLLNNLLGARYSGQTYYQVVPYTANYDSSAEFKAANPLNKMSAAQSASPFDSFARKAIIAEYSYTTNKKNGVLGLIVENIYEFFGYSATNSNFRSSKSKQTGANGCWQGAMFAVKAVNNFIPSFVPQLGEASFKPATVKVGITAATGVASGNAMTGNTWKFVNNSTGLNRFYRAADGSVQQDPRYYTVIRDIQVKMGSSNPDNVAYNRNAVIGKVVAPGESLSIPVSGTYPDETQNLAITATYDVFLSASATSTAPANDSDYLFRNLTTTSYMYLSPEKGWADNLFANTDESGIMGAASRTGYVTASTTGGSNRTTRAEYYRDFLIPDNNATVINNYGLMINGGGSFDTMFSYPVAGTKYLTVTDVDDDGNYVTGAEATVPANATSMAYAVFDSKTGDLLNLDLQDFKWDSEDEWDLGEGDAGFDEDAVQAEIATKATFDADGNITSCPGYKTRTHIAYTAAEAVEYGVINGIVMNGSAIESIIISTDNIGAEVTPATPINGIALMGGEVNPSSNAQYIKWIRVTDTGKKFKPQEVTMNLATITGTTVGMTGSTNVIIYNNSGATELQNKYNDYLGTMSAYNKTDFDDVTGSGSTSYSPVQNALNTAFSNTVVALGSVITPQSAKKLSSITETVANTKSTTSNTGDLAYVPYSASDDIVLPSDVKTYVKNGYYYADQACTLPIYSNVELTAADVTNGKDAVGTAVTEINGKYYLANAPQYKTEWILISDGDIDYPYLMETDEQATTDDAEPMALYRQVNYNFYRANGEQMGDVGWAAKVPQTYEATKKYDANAEIDYRGTYEKYSDMLDYRVEMARKHVDTSLASIIGVGVHEARDGQVNVDYIVDTYEKMVKIAKEAESLITITPVYLTNEDGDYVDEDGEVVEEKDRVFDHNEYSTTNPSAAIVEAKRIYDQYDARVRSRGYHGEKLEAEILCATGIAANQFTVSNGDIYYTAGADAKYGAYDSTGKLYNPTIDGEKQFSDASWNAYTAALADAITATDEQTCKISEAYEYKKALMIAENNLESPSARTEITVSGKITVATSADGSGSRYGVAGAKVKIGSKTYAVADNKGAFTAVLPVGTESITITAANGVERTVTLSGEADIEGVNIGMLVGDYNEDSVVNAVDAFLFSETDKIADGNKDINGDSVVDNEDGAILNTVIKAAVVYADVALD